MMFENPNQFLFQNPVISFVLTEFEGLFGIIIKDQDIEK